jgi:steroid 5-alpha reductase family enzyme
VKQRLIWCALVALCWSALFFGAPTRSFALSNLLVQLAIFIPFANIPGWRSNRLSYVDFAWPAGLCAIGIQVLWFAGEATWLTLAVAAMYGAAGLRMAFWAAHMYLPGRLTRDLPRYEYQRRRWARAGFTSERLSVQYEILVQAMANFAFLAVPAYVVATNDRSSIAPWEIVAILVWLVAFGFESVADLQKRRYLAGDVRNRKGVCDVGLWRYTRHPNYFGQWLQWIALVTLALPSLLALRAQVPVAAFAVVGVSLAWVVYIMYRTLVHYTGAVPAEYYSRLKRAAYADYQASVNRFFPGPRKPGAATQ